MGKGKGRQSGGFTSKSQRAAFSHEIKEQSQQVRLSRPKRQSNTSKQSSDERPRYTRLTQLRGLLRERQHQEAYSLMQRRRRAGFLPRRNENNELKQEKIISHPPGWLLSYGDTKNAAQQQCPSEETLQTKCINVLGNYIMEYLDALGKEELHGSLSLLSSDALSELSVVVSQKIGITNDLAYVLGRHPHVECICFRASPMDETLNDDGVSALLPQIPSNDIQDSWEDLDDDDDALVDVLQLEGCNVQLKRLELLDCHFVSVDTILELLQKCSCISHLSLAGTLDDINDGTKILFALPNLLPALKVLDITKCAWISTSILDKFSQFYEHGERPTIHCQGCFDSSSKVDNGKGW